MTLAKRKTCNIYALGCKVNSYDSNRMAKLIEEKGIVRSKNSADFAIIHTCSVTGAAVSKNKQMVKKARKENPNAKIVLAGCWPRVAQIDERELGVDFVIKDDAMEDFWKFIEAKNSESNGNVILSEISKARYFITVQDGCEQFCSYCIIPFARGSLRSRAKDDILNEIREAVKKGYREIVISGIHLGLYGHNTDYKLADLLQDILNLPGLGRIRLSSIEPNEVTDGIISLMQTNPKFCKHLHIPLQSGCDKILKLMNRPYDTERFKEKIEKIRAAVPDVAITTDVIVGFPSESDADFETTENFIKEMKFSRLHVFSFSAHERTAAFKMDGHLEKPVISKRAAELRRLSSELEKDFEGRFRGQTLQVVLENFKKGKAKMKTEYYFDIECPLDDFKKEDVGQFRNVECV